MLKSKFPHVWSRFSSFVRRTCDELLRGVSARDIATIGSFWAMTVAIAVAVFGQSAIEPSAVCIASFVLVSLLGSLRGAITPPGLIPAAATIFALAMLPFGLLAVSLVATLLFVWNVSFSDGPAASVTASEPGADSAIVEDGSPLSDGSVAVARRHTDEGITIEGVIGSDASGSRRTVHVPFVPPFAMTPEIELEPETERVNVSLSDATPFGARLEIRGVGSVAFVAFAPENGARDQVIEAA